MKLNLLLLQLFLFSFLIVVSCGEEEAEEELVESINAPSSWLLAQSAIKGELVFYEDKKSITEVDYSATLVFNGTKKVSGFTNRPERVIKCVSNKDYTKFWNDEYRFSFSESPPNAVLHVILGEQKVQVVDYPLLLTNGTYLASETMNTMVYNISKDGDRSIKELWETLKDNDMCFTSVEEGDNSYDMRYCVLDHPALYINSWYSDSIHSRSYDSNHIFHAIKKSARTATSAVNDLVNNESTSVDSHECRISTTAKLNQALQDSGAKDTFDTAILGAQNLSLKTQIGARVTSACTQIGEAILASDSSFPATGFESCCTKVARFSKFPADTVIQATASVLCELKALRPGYENWDDFCY